MANSPGGLSIRPVGPGDLSDLCDLFIAMQVHYHGRAATSGDGLRNALRAAFLGDRPMCECLLARLHERPAGFATYNFAFPAADLSPELYLKDLFTLPISRQRGIGRALIAHLAAIAHRHGCTRMRWMTGTDEAYDAARGLYDRVGAAPRDDAVLYELSGEALTGLAEEVAHGGQ